MRQIPYYIFLFVLVVSGFSCSDKEKVEHPLFVLRDSAHTGLNFRNDLSYSKEFNLFKYIYFYNGSGVGAGDFNNDGKTDLFFGSNQGANKLFLNTGNLKFNDVTKQALIPDDGGWTTGISVVDINNDGLLDIYVCRVGEYEALHGKNLFLINQGIGKNGIPSFQDKASEMGLDFTGFSTQSAFLDYDNDGDMDMFLLNHSVHENGTFRPRKDFENTFHSQSGDRIYRNDGEHFTDVTSSTGIFSTAIGYGLGIAVGDINMDGYPDIYIGNDFHENDYLYINQKNGSFREQSSDEMMHTSQFSMGVDVGDINNDAFPEVISLDMLPADPYILKRSLGEDAYDIFNYKISVGYSHQYTRNNLQFNRKNGLFSEVGLYSNVAATDWSWAPLWMDFDNDGLKDLFISNGIPKRMNDIDYINFVSNSEVRQKIRSNSMEGKDLSLIEKFPQIKLPNKFFRNKGNLVFEDDKARVENDVPSYSNGSVYADFDNDGDLDIVVNNIDDAAILYENNSVDSASDYLQLQLKGPAQNINAVGSRVIVYTKGETRTYEKYPARGFLSSMEIPLLIGLKNTAVDSIILVWPDRTYQTIDKGNGNRLTVPYREGLPQFDFTRFIRASEIITVPANDITLSTGLEFLHEENHFVEFDREQLIPHMVSTEGPALAVGDINGDGLQDVYVGGARDKQGAVFLQQASGQFVPCAQPDLEKDSIYEDVDACFADLNKDGKLDLVVATGGNEFYGQDPHNLSRVYLNDGRGGLHRAEGALPFIMTASCVAPVDFNKDGFTDLFIGGRTVPWGYGQVPRSYLLMNDGNGKFTDVSLLLAPELADAGMVTDARWFDLDKDGDMDLLLSLEWGKLTAFINNKGTFTRKVLSERSGWWNFILPLDIDNDGDMDLVAGNLGWNSRLKATEKEPVRLYYNDFDGNGIKEQVLTYYVEGKEIPFASKAELEKQVPILKKKFLYAEDFAKSSLTEIFGSNKLDAAKVYTADYFSNAVLINKGNLDFEIKALPWTAQLTSYRDGVVINANNDSLPDILLGGNYYDNNIQMSRYDADFGTVLINKGKGVFVPQLMKDLSVKGQVRHVEKIKIGTSDAFILARNNDSLKVILFPPGH